MCKFILFHFILSFVLFGLSYCSTSFDQRQTGDFNVQVGLKNIQLIALLKGANEEYVDYDYAYDYSEMTIKPQNGTTAKPIKPSTQSNVTTSSPSPSAVNVTELSVNDTHYRINETEQSLNPNESNTNETGSSMNATVHTEASDDYQTDTVAANYSTLSSTEKLATDDGPIKTPSDSSSDSITAPVATNTNCRRGFVQNNNGKCEYKVHGTTNALRRIVKLAQKIKIGRGYKGT